MAALNYWKPARSVNTPTQTDRRTHRHREATGGLHVCVIWQDQLTLHQTRGSLAAVLYGRAIYRGVLAALLHRSALLAVFYRGAVMSLLYRGALMTLHYSAAVMALPYRGALMTLLYRGTLTGLLYLGALMALLYRGAFTGH